MLGRKYTFKKFSSNFQDSLNEAWENLLELIDTRTQMLAASAQLHKFFHDCRDTLSRILEKSHSIPEDLGRDASSVSKLVRKHQNFLNDLQTIETQVGELLAFCKACGMGGGGHVRVDEHLAVEQRFSHICNAHSLVFEALYEASMTETIFFGILKHRLDYSMNKFKSPLGHSLLSSNT